MKKYSELLRKQIEVIGALNTLFYIADIEIDEKDMERFFRIAERTNGEYMIIFALKNGVGGRKYRYAEIGRLLGKKRSVIRKKYKKCEEAIMEGI
ncbi:MAG: hypothetical protein WBH76_01420 [Dictyoglomaceae bacterium]